MPTLLTISAAISLFDHTEKNSCSAITREALANNGCLVPCGKIYRVDYDKLQQVFPTIAKKVPKEWLFTQTSLEEEITIQALSRLLPFKFDDGMITTIPQLKTMIQLGQWARRQAAPTLRYYDLAQFKAPWSWAHPDEWKFHKWGLHLKNKKGDLATKASALCLAWSDALQEKRLGVKRALGTIDRVKFDEDFAKLKKQVEDAPWDHKDMVALLKGANV